MDVAEQLPSPEALSDRYDCLVIDHRSMPVGARSATPLAALRIPVVVLASHPQDMAARGFERVVVKPFLGHRLIEAVRDALKNEPRCATPT